MSQALPLTSVWQRLGPGPLGVQVVTGVAMVLACDDIPQTDETDGTIVAAVVGQSSTPFPGSLPYWAKGVATGTLILVEPLADIAQTPSQTQTASPTVGILTKTALAAIQSHRVVKAASGGILLASQDQTGDADLAIGLTLNATTAAGQPIEVMTDGEVAEATWNWSIGPVFLGVAGTLTQMPPTTGFLQRIGVATSPTSIVVAIQEATVRA